MTCNLSMPLWIKGIPDVQKANDLPQEIVSFIQQKYPKLKVYVDHVLIVSDICEEKLGFMSSPLTSSSIKD